MKRAIKRLQALFLVLAMCTSVLQATALAAETTDTSSKDAHVYEVSNVEFDKDGNYTGIRKCKADGHSDEAEEQLKGKGTVKEKKEATCTEPETVKYTVTLEGKEWVSDAFETAPAKGHGKTEEKSVLIKAPTCSEEGSYRIDKVCTVCGKTVEEGEEQKSQKVEHEWETKTNEDGSTTKTCKVCGESETTAAPHDHKAGEIVKENVKEPDCKTETDGSHDEVEYCEICGKELSRKTVKDAFKHTPGKPTTDPKSVVQATCAKEGSHVEITKCTVCDKELNKETKTDAKVAHSKAKEPIYENDTATCLAAGTRDEVYKCVICGQDFSRTKVESPKKEHKPLSPVKENEVTATCTKEGSYDSVVYCDVGKEEISREHVTVPKTAHAVQPAIVWDEDEDTLYEKETPTVSVNSVCADCGEDAGEIAEPDVKEDKDKFVAGAFDCQPGSKTFTATYTYKDEKGKEVTITDSKTFKYFPNRKHSSHTPGAATIENKVEPTCTEDGKYDVVVKCTVCGDIISSVPGVTGKTGHVPGKVVIENAKDATCTAAGSHDEVIYCPDCGEELSRKTVEDAAIAHTPGEAVKENVTDTSYDEVVKCSVCGEEISRKTVTTEKPADPEPTKPEPEKPHTHTPAKAVKENVVKATYAKAGSYTLVVRCSECGEVISTTQKVTAKKKVPGTTLKSVKNVKGKKIKATWKKVSGINGYQVQYCLNKSFMNTKTFQTTGTTKTMTGLKKNKKYYVRARTYKRVGGKVYFAKWSAPKSVKIKK